MILVIDTATEACSSALLNGDRVIARRHELVGRGHAERLVPQVAELLAEAGIARADALLVDCGPGSFTGVRVGLAAARGFALAWDVPVHGYASLASIAAAAELGEADTIAVALTGGHGELFVQRFGGRPLAPLADLVSAPDVAARLLPEAVVRGSGAAALVAARGHGEPLAAWPDAAEAARLPTALRRLPPVPLYGRAPDARRGVTGPLVLAACGVDELDAVMAVMDSAFDPRFGEAWNRAQTAGMLGLPGVRLLVASRAGRPAGFALSRVAADEAELLLLAVTPALRRAGIGRALLDRMFADLHARGARRLHLEMRCGNPAEHLYRAEGFSAVGRRPAYYRGMDGTLHDAISLARDLPRGDNFA